MSIILLLLKGITPEFLIFSTLAYRHINVKRCVTIVACNSGAMWIINNMFCTGANLILGNRVWATSSYVDRVNY